MNTLMDAFKDTSVTKMCYSMIHYVPLIFMVLIAFWLLCKTIKKMKQNDESKQEKTNKIGKLIDKFVAEFPAFIVALLGVLLLIAVAYSFSLGAI